MRVLTIIGIAFAVMFRVISPKKGLSKLGGLALGIILMPFFIQLAEASWKGLPLAYKLTAAVLLLPTFFLVLTRLVFGREVYREVLAHMLYGLFACLMKALLVFATFLGAAAFRGFARAYCLMRHIWNRQCSSPGITE